jgi:hypothetical protein
MKIRYNELDLARVVNAAIWTVNKKDEAVWMAVAAAQASSRKYNQVDLERFHRTARNFNLSEDAINHVWHTAESTII